MLAASFYTTSQIPLGVKFVFCVKQFQSTFTRERLTFVLIWARKSVLDSNWETLSLCFGCEKYFLSTFF